MRITLTITGLILGYFVAYGLIHLGKIMGANVFFLGTVFKMYFWSMLICGGLGFVAGLIFTNKKPGKTGNP